jgi:hypothetical protein
MNNIKKIKKNLIIVFIILFLILALSYFTLLCKISLIGTAEYLSASFIKQEEELKINYGHSDYEQTINGIQIGVEKITTELYFITYSWMSGNLTYNAITLNIENIDRSPLGLDNYISSCATDNLGNRYYPMYYKESPYPPDDPLGYKNVLFIKFWPFDSKAKTVSLYLKYAGAEYVFCNMPIR